MPRRARRRPRRAPDLRSEAGFTLLEVLLVAGLLSVVVAAAALFVPTALRISARDAVRVDAMDRAGVVLAQLRTDVRAATALRAPAADVLELDVLVPRPGAPAVERVLRWDCGRPDPAGRACRRTDGATGDASGGLTGLVDDGRPVLQLLPGPAGGRAGVAIRLPVAASAGRRPVVLETTVTQRACPRARGTSGTGCS